MHYELFELQDEGKQGYYGFNLINGEDVVMYNHDPDYPGTLMTQGVAQIRAERRVELFNAQPPTQQEPAQPEVQDGNTGTTLGPIEFMTRFSAEEYSKLLVLREQVRTQFEQGVSADSVAPETVALFGFFVMWDKVSIVDLTYPQLVAGLTLVCTTIGMSPERITEVLTP